MIKLSRYKVLGVILGVFKVYRKIILCLLFPFFSSSENLYAEPSVTEIVVAAVVTVVVTKVALNVYKRCNPTADEIIRNAEAHERTAKYQKQIAIYQEQTAKYQEQLDYLEARENFAKWQGVTA